MFREHQIRINYAWILNDIERCALCITIGSSQPAANFAKRLGVSQLTKQHGHELSPAGEAPGMALGFCAGAPRIQILVEKKDAKSARICCIHDSRLSLRFLNWFLVETQSQVIRGSAFFV